MRIFILISFFMTFSVFSQTEHYDKPNYKKIKRAVKKKKSDFYYHKLFKKFSNPNSKMTLEEKRFLYYGYIYQKRYKPFGYSKYRDSLNIYAKKQLTKESIQKMIYFSDNILSSNPFNIEVLTYKSYLHRKAKDATGYQLAKKQLNIIFDVILSSGNGKSKATAYHIIYREHKTDILKHLKLKFNGIRKTIEKFRIEYLNVTKNKYGIRGVYFNVKAFKIDLKSK